jgi:polar amino acid transport system substrate-binding protein
MNLHGLSLALLARISVLALGLSGGGFALASDGAPLPLKSLPIGVSEFRPFEYTAPSGRVVGADTEIVEQILMRLGYQPQFMMQPWPRVQREAARGAFAGLYSLTKTPEREQLYHFTAPINTVKDVFFKRKSMALDWKTLDDLRTLRVSSAATYGYAPEFRQALAEKRFAEVHEIYDDDPQLRGLRRLASGVTDVFICEISVCSDLIKLHAPAFDQIDFAPQSVGPVRSFHMAFSKNWPQAEALRDAFDAELAQQQSKGMLRRIYQKYGMEPALK